MNMHNTERLEAELVEVTITNRTPNEDAFGVTGDGESVYVSPSLARTFGIDVGQKRMVKLCPNDPQHRERGVLWRAFFVEPAKLSAVVEEEPDEEVETTEDIILNRMAEVGLLSTGQVAQLTGMPTVRVRKVLERMHRQRLVLRADVFLTAEQTKASKSLWAPDESKLWGGKGL